MSTVTELRLHGFAEGRKPSSRGKAWNAVDYCAGHRQKDSAKRGTARPEEVDCALRCGRQEKPRLLPVWIWPFAAGRMRLEEGGMHAAGWGV